MMSSNDSTPAPNPEHDESAEILAGRARAYEEARASGQLLLALDPKLIRSTEFRNRDPHALLVHDQDFVELTRAIQRHGQHTPIRVRPVNDGSAYEYEIVFGHRRHAACLVLDASSSHGFKVLASIDADCADAKNLVLKMYLENAARLDLSAYETGRMFQQWLDENLFSNHDSIAAAIGKSKQLVGKYLAIAGLPDYVLKAFRDPRGISLRWGADLRRQLEADGPALHDRALELAARKVPPAPEEVFAELISGPKLKKLSKRKHSEIIKDGKKVLFRFTAKHPGHYDIRLSKHLDAQAYRDLQNELKSFVLEWLKGAPPGSLKFKSLRG
jgi:ParB family chromosome partitioning protein